MEHGPVHRGDRWRMGPSLGLDRGDRWSTGPSLWLHRGERWSHGTFTAARQWRSVEYGPSIGLLRWKDSSRPVPCTARFQHLRACCRTASAPRRPPWSHIVGHVVMPLVSVLKVVVVLVVVRRAKLCAKMFFSGVGGSGRRPSRIRRPREACGAVERRAPGGGRCLDELV